MTSLTESDLTSQSTLTSPIIPFHSRTKQTQSVQTESDQTNQIETNQLIQSYQTKPDQRKTTVILSKFQISPTTHAFLPEKSSFFNNNKSILPKQTQTFQTEQTESEQTSQTDQMNQSSETKPDQIKTTQFMTTATLPKFQMNKKAHQKILTRKLAINNNNNKKNKLRKNKNKNPNKLTKIPKKKVNKMFIDTKKFI